MPRTRKPARIVRKRGGWYLWYFDPDKRKTVRVACAALDVFDEAGRVDLLTKYRAKENAQAAERIMRGAVADFDAPLLPKIDAFIADVQRRAKLRRTVEGSREGLSYSAAATYEGVLRDFKAWVTAEHPIMTTGGLDANTLQTYVGYLAAGTAKNGRRRGSATLNKHRAHLKTFVNWLAEQRPRQLQDPELLRKALRPAVVPQREIQPYSPKELREFHDALPPRARRLFKLICATGMRLSEAMTRTFDDLDFPSGRLTIRVASKTGKRRWVPLKETAPTLLKEMRKWERTDRLCGVNFYPRKDWEKAQKTVHITAQGIRRTFISVCIDFGIPAAIASQFLGHGIPVMERYYLMQIPRKRARSIQAAMGF